MDEHSIFVAALECDDEQQQRALLRDACGDDDVLRRRIARLLKLHESAGEFLEQPVLPNRSEDGLLEPTNSMIGPYRLHEQIGSGGMGVVFAGEQLEPVRRRVAIKIIKPGMDTKQVIARFEAERQALALMEHPNIARVFDADATDSGRPYFVMELVQGIPVTQYCDRERMTTTDRLELFLSICDAVQHAHQKGIIHRDIKPSNVLVTHRDGKPAVKMIDFGVAKATTQRLTDRTLFTGLTQMIGTPIYMSPEQAEQTGIDVDTRSDVYSLGVLLYELLTGSTPFERERLSEVGYDEMRRIIREEEPPRPSNRVSSSSRVSTVDAAAMATVFEQRGTNERRLKQTLQGELDWIVLKAIEKSRARRYQSAADLSDDVKRFLAGKPVAACPPSISYQARKLIGRHRTAFASVCAILSLLIVSVGVSTWLALRAVRAERVAKESQQTAETKAAIAIAMNDFLTDDLLRQASPFEEPDRDVKLRDVVDRASRRLDGHFEGQPLVEAAIRMSLGTTSFYIGDYEVAAKHFDRARALRSRELGPRAAETLETVFWQGRAKLQRAGAKVAAPAFENLLPIQQAVLGPEHHETLLTMDWLAYCYVLSGLDDKAEPLMTRAAEAFKRVLGPEHPDTLDCLDGLAILYRNQERFDLAEQLSQAVLATRRRVLGDEHPQSLESLGNLAALYSKMGNPTRAIEMCERSIVKHREVYGDTHPFTLNAIVALATTLQTHERFEEAEQQYLSAIEGQLSTLGADDESTLRTMRRLALLYARQKRFAEAETLHEQVLSSRQRTLGMDNIQTQDDAMQLAGLLQRVKRYGEAEKIVARVLESRERQHGVNNTGTLSCRMRLAFLKKLQRRWEEAERVFDQAFRESQTLLGEDHQETLRAANQLSYLWGRSERLEEAELLCMKTLEARRRTLGDTHRDTASSLTTLAMICGDQARPEEAVPLLQEALEIQTKVLGKDDPQSRNTARRLVQAQRAAAESARMRQAQN